MKAYQTPYYAVIFTSKKNQETAGYDQVAQKMIELAQQQPGFLGIQSVRDQSHLGITVSYWKSLDDIAGWKSQLDHQAAQKKGKSEWYAGYEVRISKVENYYGFGEDV